MQVLNEWQWLGRSKVIQVPRVQHRSRHLSSGSRGLHCAELSPPSLLLQLYDYAVVGDLRTRLRKAWSLLSRSIGTLRGEKMSTQTNQR